LHPRTATSGQFKANLIIKHPVIEHASILCYNTSGQTSAMKTAKPIFKFRGVLRYSSCQRYLIGSKAGATHLFDPVTHEEISVFKKARGVIGAIFLPDGEHVAFAEYMYNAGVYRIDNGQLVGKKWKLIEKSLDVVAFLPTPNPDEFLHAAWDGPPRMLDRSGKTMRRFGGRSGGPGTNDVAFSPDCTLLAVVTDANVWVYDWYSETLKYKIDVFADLERNTANARHGHVKFVSDSQIVVGNGAGKVRLYDLKSEQVTFEFAFQYEEAHSRAFAINLVIKLIAFRGAGSLQFYNLESLQDLGSLELHKVFATIENFSPKHGTFAAGLGEAGAVFRTDEILAHLK
jgi:WD40 repeat protein